MRKLSFNLFFERTETVFQILFLIYTILGFNSVTFGNPVISCFMWAAYFLGAVLLVIRVWKWKEYIQMPGMPLLLLMCVICAVSILVNRQYDLKKNTIYLIFWVFYFFLFYTQNLQVSPELVKKRFCLLGHVICVCAFLLAVISLWMMYARYSEVTHVNGSEVTRGFTYGRLFGAYLTPNGGAVVGSIVIFLSIHFIGKYRNVFYRVWTLVNIFTQFAYITFSDSRSGTLALAFGGAVYVCFAILGSAQIKQGTTKGISALVLTSVTLVGCIFAPMLAQKVYNRAVVSFSERLAQQQVETPVETETFDVSAETQPTEVPVVPTETSAPQTEPTQNDELIIQPEELIDSYVVDRGYDLSNDISNRRFDVWKSGLEIFAQRPWLGTTFCGFLPFAQEHMPETYIVSNDYRQMDTLDNDFMNLLVSNGIIAFAAFILFVVWVITYIFRGYFRMKMKDSEIPVMMAVCMAAATFSLFTSGILYMHSPFSVIFWFALGGLVVIVSNGNKEKNHG